MWLPVRNASIEAGDPLTPTIIPSVMLLFSRASVRLGLGPSGAVPNTSSKPLHT
jgi:hypothetical protein